MSVATLITGGLGSFGTVPLLLLDGLGSFASGVPLGGGDYSQWEVPPFTPFGQRRILDTSGIDLAAQERARLDQARREIGLLKEPEAEIEAAPAIVPSAEPAVVQVQPAAPPAAIPFDADGYAKTVTETLLAEMRRVDDERAERDRLARIAWRRADDEAVLLMAAAV